MIRSLLSVAFFAAILGRDAAADIPLVVGKANATADTVLPVDVGNRLGIFKQHGLSLKIVEFAGGSRLIQAVAAGDIDIAVAAGTEMAFVAKGIPMLAVCETAKESILHRGGKRSHPVPIVLGLASSHAPSMFTSADRWPAIHRVLSRGIPQPPEFVAETPEVLEAHVHRVKQGFATLKAQLDAAKPDAVIIIGDDQNELFSNALIPGFAIFVGASAEGTLSIGLLGEKPKDNWITLSCHPILAKAALEGLIERGFDFAYSEKLLPMARPEIGLGHAFTRIARVMGLAEAGIPTVLIFTNAYHPPLPTAARCYALGQALHDIFASRPERVAFYASGGLSHDPMGPRAGWVDEPLDRWVLDSIARGDGARLRSLFTTDSDTMRGGTGEIRSWIAVAGAFDGRKATVVDYIPARHAVTGLGFAYWNGDA